MKKTLLLLFLIIVLQPCDAQSPVDSPRVEHRSGWQVFLDNFRLRFPTIEVNYAIPVKNKSLLGLPYGMDKFMYHTKPAIASWSLSNESYSFRLLALYYKDRVGVEWYTDAFGGSLNLDDYNAWLVQQFPGYTIRTFPYFGSSLLFSGQRVGIAYKMHLKSFIIEPKAQWGFEALSLAPENYLFRQNGSNQFTEYQVARRQTNNNAYSYRGQIFFAKRFFSKKSTRIYEAGIKGEYIYAPYALQFTLTQKPYGMPVQVHQFDWKGSFTEWGFGVYGAFYLRK